LSSERFCRRNRADCKALSLVADSGAAVGAGCGEMGWPRVREPNNCADAAPASMSHAAAASKTLLLPTCIGVPPRFNWAMGGGTTLSKQPCELTVRTGGK
jgi:hypothetical protein